MHRPLVAVLFFVLVLLGGPRVGQGQARDTLGGFCEDPARRTRTIDTRGLGAVYCASSPLLVTPLQAAHASARPVFFGAVPAAWGGALIAGEKHAYADAFRLTVSQGATYGVVLALKHAVGRPRPYVRPAIVSRSSHYATGSESAAFTSFPSGHASVSATLVTSWSLSHPRWYVIGPGAVWATAVSLSRLHLGVHYPSDVLVGAGIGVGMAFLVHHLRGTLTPDVIRADARNGLHAPPPITLQFRF